LLEKLRLNNFNLLTTPNLYKKTAISLTVCILLFGFICVNSAQAGKIPQPLRRLTITDDLTGHLQWNFDRLEHDRNSLYNGEASLEVNYISAETIAVTTLEVSDDIETPTIEVDTIREYTSGHGVSIESVTNMATLEVNLIRGKTGLPVTIGDTNFDRLDIADDGNSKGTLQKIGDDQMNWLFNAYYDGAWNEFDSTRHSLRSQYLGETGRAFFRWMIAQPTTEAPIYVEYLQLTETGTLQAGSDNAQDLGTLAKEWRDLFVDGTANLDTISMPAQTRYFSIGAPAFGPESEATDFTRTSNLQNDDAGFANKNFRGVVTLPEGATVTAFTAYYYRDDASATITIDLNENVVATATETVMARVTGTGTGGFNSGTDSTITNPTIDNDTKTYYVICYMDNNNAVTDVRLVSCKVTYTVTEPLP
jgi:hypothetical protein